jgi:uncharacterized Zn finger protein
MTIPNLTREKIEEHTAGGSYERGKKYLANGAVRALQRPDPQTVEARVQGGDVHPYLVTVTFDDEDIRSVKCTCPYFEGSWCKHIVAALLKTLKQDEIPVAQSGRLANLVADLDRDEIVSLLERLVERDPRLLDAIRAEHPQVVEDPDSAAH